MKTIGKYLVCVGVALFGLTACVQDLDVEPQDENKILDFNQDAVFSKCYATLALTGQSGPAGSGDVDDIDEGTSAFIRMVWELQEFPTDECWVGWNDPGLPEIRTMKWNSLNQLVQGLYYRLYFNITLCNHFLENASEEGDGANQIAEVRFLRAFNYYYLLDMYGNVPFADKVNAQKKPQYTRVQLFNWLEDELKDLENKLPATRTNDFRVDVYAAKMLLARLYLNAEVYTGTAQWQKAADYAKEVMDGPHKLHTTSLGGVYTPYQEMFMGDNYRVVGGAAGEGLLNIYQDGIYAQAWGGSTFLVAAARDKNVYVNPATSEGWAGYRCSPEFIEKWVALDQTPFILKNEFDMPAQLGDDRAIICSVLNTGAPVVTPDPEITTADSIKPRGSAGSSFYDSWSMLKWTGRYIENPLGEDITVTPHGPQFPDTDVPFMRAGEAYMTYAEAQFRLGNTAAAATAIQALRDRAHNTQTFTVDEDFLLDEWSREFFAEGRRRIDLVRFGKFAGPTADYHWEGRGGNTSDQGLVMMDAKYNIYPIPESDIVAGGLTQNEGY
jgi:hypothetical protein